jgi:penicillin-insensitive murein endopeptidase
MRANTRVPRLLCRTAAALLAVAALPTSARADDVGPVPTPASIESHAPAVAEGLDPILAEPSASDPQSLVALAQRRLPDLGPLSIGTPDAGLLVNPMPMPAGPYWKLRNPLESFGTAETIEYLVTAIESVEARFPGSPHVVIGDLSRPDGGRLNRHRSHQAGRDADIGFYYARGEAPDFELARRKDLDLPRTWALVRALITETDVDRIFVDRSLIAVLYAYARDEENEDRDWLDDVFGRRGEGRKGIIQHERGHKNHLHVRFFNPRAQEYGRIVYPVLVDEGAVPPPCVKHRVTRGETIGKLASRYGTTTSAIRSANGLRSTQLRAGRSYLIPVRRVRPDAGPIVVPARRLPPAPLLHVAVGAAAGLGPDPAAAVATAAR